MKVIRKDLIERLEKIRKDFGDNPSAFAKKCGIDPSGMRRKLAGLDTITAKNIVNISKAFGVNREWLDTGEGEMYAHTHYNISGNTNIGSHVENSVQVSGDIPMDKIADILKNAASKDLLIDVLQKQVEELQAQNGKLMDIISRIQVGGVDFAGAVQSVGKQHPVSNV